MASGGPIIQDRHGPGMGKRPRDHRGFAWVERQCSYRLRYRDIFDYGKPLMHPERVNGRIIRVTSSYLNGNGGRNNELVSGDAEQLNHPRPG